MCVRPVCERLAQPTESKRCPICGFRTERWDESRAQRLRRQSGLPLAPPPEADVLIVTTNDIPGYRVVKVHGDVFGLIVRARNALSNAGASLRTLSGGKVAGYTKLLADSRNEARARLKHEARKRGANAIIAMRFDCNAIGDIMTEVAAYGTAVTIVATDAPEEA